MTDFDEGGGGAPMSPAQLLQVAQRRATALTEPVVEDVESGAGESETMMPGRRQTWQTLTFPSTIDIGVQ